MSEPAIELQTLEHAQQRTQQLQQALTSRIVIEQAKGVLAERFGLTLDQAFDLLRSSARSNRQSIHKLASEIVDGSETPGSVIRALAGRSDYIAAADRRLNRLGQVASQLRQARLAAARRQEGERRRR